MHTHAFPRSARLLCSTDFQRVFGEPKKFRASSFTLLYRENRDGQARLGLVVSRKISTKATERNRLKRVIRENFRHCLQRLPGIDMVFVVRRGAAQMAPSVFQQQVAQACRWLVV